jgi:hypothetical protein
LAVYKDADPLIEAFSYEIVILLRAPITRYCIKASIVLLWLVALTTSAAVAAPRPINPRSHVAHGHARAMDVKTLARHAASVGTSLVRIHKVRPSLVTRRAHFHRDLRRNGHADDDDAIQNDAPAANVAVELFLALRQLGVFVEVLEQQPFTLHESPRSPRGPPATA